MECLTPKNGYPCGVCPRCRLNRQRDWTFRLSCERDASDFVFWLALTFDDDHLRQALSSAKAAREPSRHFLESIRKKFGDQIRIKHFLVTEYGDGTDRFHHHCLLFCKTVCNDFSLKTKLRKELFDFIGCNNWDRSNNTAWPYGGVQYQPLHAGVFPYVTNYVNKPELIGKDHEIRPFTRISQGIGLEYIDRVDKTKFYKGDLSVWFEGSKKVLPRYYREKIFPTSIYSARQAAKHGDYDLVDQIFENRFAHQQQLSELEIKKSNQLWKFKRDFEHDHSITYEESLQHLAANEFRRYKEKLKKRQNL